MFLFPHTCGNSINKLTLTAQIKRLFTGRGDSEGKITGRETKTAVVSDNEAHLRSHLNNPVNVGTSQNCTITVSVTVSNKIIN